MKKLRSKRLLITFIAFFVNMIIFVLGLYEGSNLTTLSTGLVMIDSLVFSYVWHETKRPSEKET